MLRLVVAGAQAGPDALLASARAGRVPVDDVRAAATGASAADALRAAAADGADAGLVAADLVVHASLLGDVLDDPRRPLAALVLDDGRLGALRLDAASAGVVADLLPAPADAGPDAVLSAVLDALTKAGLPVARVTPGRLVALRPAPGERDAAVAALAATDERTARLDGAARPGDGFYSTFVLRRLSRLATGVAVRLGATPNAVTLTSLAIGLAGAALLVSPAVAPRGLGALLLQVSIVVDCVDGELARYSRSFSALGAWLDGVSDRVKEYAVLAALAVAAGGRTGWLLAVAGLAVMTYRHVADHHFTVRLAATAPPAAPGLAPAVAVPRETASVWLRRVLQLPVGERTLLVSVLAAVAGPLPTLAAFAGAAAASAVWTTGGRVLRSRALPGSVLGRLGWLRPALRLVAEAAVVAAVFAWRAPDRVWLGYALLAVVAYHAYDTVYRAKHRVAGPPAAVRVAALGSEGRAAVVVVAAVAGGTALTAVTAVLVVAFGALFGGESLDAWLRWLRGRPSIEEER